MKKRKKLGRKLLSVLLTLALVIGLMPGMGLTAYAQELSGFVTIDDVSAGDIIGTNVEDFMCYDYTITLLANRHGDRNGNVKTTDTVLGNDFSLNNHDGVFIYSGGNFYYPYDAYGICEAFEVTEIDHNNRTATLAGFSSPDNSVLLNSAIEYCYYNGSSYLSGTTPAESTYQVSADSKKWTDGRWYVVTDDVTIENRISINGTVRLVLCDGVTLNAPNGISLKSGNSLIIYGQTNGSGILNANNNAGAAGIGSENEGTCGNLTINSGTVNATGGYLAAGIGGGNYGSSGTVTINGGIVNATGGSYTGDVLPAGIGGGYGGGHGVLNIGEGVVLKGSDNNDEWIDITDSSIRKYYMRAAIGNTQTITASDVTATYGDTDKSVSASVTKPATGGGAISYAVKEGSGDYISVASDGKLTIKKVPASGKAYVIVKAAETDDYAETTKEVTVTISKAEATVAAKDQGIMVGDTVPDLSAPVLNTHYSVTGLVGTDALTTAPTLAYQKNGSAATPDSATAGTYDIVPSGASAGDNYTVSYTNGTLTITAKDTQTITASDVTATYGETDKSVSATTDGNGEISYAVKAGSENYIDVNASTGALTIKAVPADGKASVTVTASETTTGGTGDKGYAAATKDVTVNISKATVTIAAKDQSIYVGGTVPTLSGADFYTVTGLVGEETLTTNPTLAYQKNGSAATPDSATAGTYDIVPSGAAASDNYSISYTNGTLTISNKGTQTISAENVTATYGDTDKSVSATVTDPATGGGDISYAVKEGSGDYIDVDATTGALTIKKVPADGKAYVTVTAAETATYAQTTKEVTVTISKANAVTATVTAKNRTYDGTEKPLVTVTGKATGGGMQYALGTKTEATEAYTASIPKKTEVGTYYVWYKAVGDDNYLDSKEFSVKVDISAADKTDLQAAIEDAQKYYESIKDNDDYKEIADTLKTALDTAKTIAAKDDVTSSEVKDAVKNISDAKSTAEKAVESVDDKNAVKAVTDMINALPSSYKIAATDKEAIEAARKAYNALTADQKKRVDATTFKKLTNAETALAAVENKNDEAPGNNYSSEWVDGLWYNSDGTQTYGYKGSWKLNGTGWWFEDEAGWYPAASWQKIDGKWYYFDASGYMASNEWVDGYWLSGNGAWEYQYIGSWKTNGSGWWYEDTSGWYPVSQWQKIDGKWYYFGSDGIMATDQYIGEYWVGNDGSWQ